MGSGGSHICLVGSLSTETYPQHRVTLSIIQTYKKRREIKNAKVKSHSLIILLLLNPNTYIQQWSLGDPKIREGFSLSTSETLH